MKIIDQTITPTVLYGCSGWTVKIDFAHKLKKAQRQMLRTILHKRRRPLQVDSSSSDSTSSDATNADEDGMESWVHWMRRVTAEVEIEREKCGIKAWDCEQRVRKLRWAGHVARMPDFRWAKVLLLWQPAVQLHGRRSQGHPRKRWSDELDEFGDWLSIASDREAWRKVCATVL